MNTDYNVSRLADYSAPCLAANGFAGMVGGISAYEIDLSLNY